MSQTVADFIFAAPFVIFIAILAVVSIWSGRTPKSPASAPNARLAHPGE